MYKVANMKMYKVADIKVDMVADIKLYMMADMKVDMVANMKLDMVADMKVYMVADMKVDMVAPITSLWPCPGQGVELVTPHNHGPRPTGLTAVGGGLMRTPLAPASATRTEEGEGSAETRLTPPSPTRSPRRSPPISPAPAALMRRSRRAAAVDANLQMQREYI